MASRQRRLMTDYVNARKDGAACGFDIRLINPDDYEHYYILFTPLNGVYKGQQYVIQLDTVWNEERYPICRPKVKFLNNCWHVNVGASGGICVTFLNDAAQWVPSYTFTSIMQSIALLFDEPNPASPMNGEAGKLWNQCTVNYKASNVNKMTINDAERAYFDCYKEFIQRAASQCGPVKEYIKWFPQIDQNYYQKNIMAISTEESEFKELADAILKKKSATQQPAEPQAPQQPANPQPSPQPNVQEQPANPPAEPQAPQPPNAPPKATRWAKYQTKK